jgi:TatA/E family protein of Tat protein translocase
MFGLRPEHIVLIVIVALLLFGPKQLPELGKSLGKAINEFRGAAKEASSALKEETEKPSEAKKKKRQNPESRLTNRKLREMSLDPRQGVGVIVRPLASV